MNLRIPVLVSVLVCSFCVACGSDDDSPASGGDALRANCQKLCAITEPLNCPDDPTDCVNDCQLGVTAGSTCRSELEAGVACSANRPASDWMCDEFGEAALKETACTAETDAIFTCLGG